MVPVRAESDLPLQHIHIPFFPSVAVADLPTLELLHGACLTPATRPQLFFKHSQVFVCPTLDFFSHISAELMEGAFPSKSVRILHLQPFCHLAFIGLTMIRNTILFDIPSWEEKLLKITGAICPVHIVGLVCGTGLGTLWVPLTLSCT